MAEAVLTTQRDYGDRTDRKHSRLKYTIDDRGLEWFAGEVERRSGVKLGPERPYAFTEIEDPLGWHRCADGTWFYGLHILSGRIKDLPGWPMKTALREIAAMHTGDFRLTTAQNVTISGVTAEQKPKIEALLAQHGLSNENERSRVRINALSCVALPTCGLALAESERVLPEVLARLEPALQEAGLEDEPISDPHHRLSERLRAPVPCGDWLRRKSAGKYALYLGASYNGTRMNRLAAPSVTVEAAVEMLRPMFQRFARSASEDEGFGDFCDRAILPADATLHSVGSIAPAAART